MENAAASVLDAHVHLWDPALPDYAWLRPAHGLLHRRYDERDLAAAFASAANRIPVHAAVAVQAAETERETRALLALAARASPVAAVVGWIDVEASGTAALSRLRTAPGGERLAGIRVNALLREPDWLASAPPRPGFAAVAAAGLVVEAIADAPRLAAAARLARALAPAPLVVGHLAHPPAAAPPERRAWERALRRLAAEPNAHVKLSGVATLPSDGLAAAVATALDAFGPERVLFGSDWPVCLQRAAYPEVVERVAGLLDAAGATATEQALVWGGAARRVYGLAGTDLGGSVSPGGTRSRRGPKRAGGSP